MSFRQIILSCGILLFTVTAHAGLIQTNGNFEADSHLFDSHLVQASNKVSAIPTGWEYDDYAEYGVQPQLMDVSGIGNGEGGTVGVRFPNWNADKGWRSALVQKGPVITAGTYEFTTTFIGRGKMGDKVGEWYDLHDDPDKLYFNTYWIEDLDDPWEKEKYGSLSRGSVELTSDHKGNWQTRTSGFVVDENSAGFGKYFATWIEVKNYSGHIIVGEASLSRISVPEPATLFLLLTGLLGLVMLRKDSLPRQQPLLICVGEASLPGNRFRQPLVSKPIRL